VRRPRAPVRPERTLAGLVLTVALAAGCTPRPAPALWLARDDDTRLWLFGSVHVAHPDTRWRSPEFQTAWNAADLLVLETRLDADGTAALAAEAAAAERLPDAQRLSHLLPPTDAARLDQAAKRLGLPRTALEGLRPYAVTLRLMSAQAAALGQSAAAGVESTLLREAIARKLPVLGLESAGEQVAALASLSPEAELKLLQAQLSDLEQDPRAKERLDALWLRGDMAGLQREIEAEFADNPELRAALLDRRDAGFASALRGLLARREGDVFVVLGAAHMAGADGVPERLRRAGVVVERR